MIDVARQARSAAAMVRGFATHNPAIRIAGVILNHVGSERHRAFVADAIAAINVPVLGALPREAASALPERTLAWCKPANIPDFAALIDRLAATAETYFDLDAIAACAGRLRSPRSCKAHWRYRHPVSALRSPATGPSASFIRIWSMPGAGPAPRLNCSRRLRTNRRRPALTVAGCPAAIRELHADKLAGARTFSAGPAPFRRDASGARRVWRLHGIGRKPGRCGGPPPRHDRVAQPRHELCPAETSSRLSHCPTAFGERPRPRGSANSRP